MMSPLTTFGFLIISNKYVAMGLYGNISQKMPNFGKNW